MRRAQHSKLHKQVNNFFRYFIVIGDSTFIDIGMLFIIYCSMFKKCIEAKLIKL